MKSIFKKIVTGALACGVILSVGACRTNKPGGDPNDHVVLQRLGTIQ